MKRRELIRTAFSSIVATAALSSLPGVARSEEAELKLKKVPADAIPKNDVPIFSPDDVFTMPEPFWRDFRGKLYIGKAGTDPTQSQNLVDVFVKDASGEVSLLQQPIALTRETMKRFVAAKGALWSNSEYSMALHDDNDQQLFYVADVKNNGVSEFSRRLAQPSGYQLIGEIGSYDALRKTRPLFNGAKVRLKGWHEGAEVGGGAFVGELTAAKDDGGYIASSGGDFHWRRVVNDLNAMTVFDFGAVADGRTDTLPAVQAMYQWAQDNNKRLSIQFPAGRFFISSFDISAHYVSFFRLAGAPVNFGYFPSTTLISGGNSDFVLKINARWVELSNISFEGRIKELPNTQGFFHNTCPAGQYFRGSCLRFSYVGGPSLSLIDTLDCKIDQWYANNCTGDVIKGTWSYTKKGNWDHNTAIELSNFNVQHCSGGKALNLPRSTQSIIHNGWIEHTEFPGDLSNGQWIVDALSIETCKNPLIAHHSRLNMRQINLQAGSWIDNSLQGDEWLGPYERGSTRVESYGIAVDGSMKYNYLTSRFRIQNNSNQEKWYELGNIHTPDVSDSWEIEILGQSQFSNGTVSDALKNMMDDRNTGGKAIITLQRKVHGFEGSWHVEGSSPIVDVIYTTEHDADTRVFVKLAGWLGSAGVLMKTTARDHFVTGQCARFDSEMAFGNPPDSARPRHAVRRFSVHNGLAGIGANEQGDLLVQSRLIEADKVDTAKAQGYVSMVINGHQVAVPYFALKQ
ncbi:phage tailspike protein [Pantoea sp. MBD-2R]|uniref:phage tailspike protein n=1 Tax=unclassified Pantoea TaxID=2630326 RepID=UPI0011BF0BA2|nr:phage tailspike protein [Pantoea sp. CCBC3-3-1]